MKSASGDLCHWAGEAGELLKLHAKLASLAPARGRPEAAAVVVVVRDVTLYVPLGELVDVSAERERLARELGKVDGDLARLEAKLADQGFVAKAPAGLLAGERARREELSGRRARLQRSLSELSGKG